MSSLSQGQRTHQSCQEEGSLIAGETLSTAEELLSSFPNNTSQLIIPVNNRNQVISGGIDIAYVSESFDPAVVVSPTLDPVDTILTQLWTAGVDEAFRFWEKDANGRLSNNYSDSVTVEPGTNRLVDVKFGGFFRRLPALVPSTFGGVYQYKTSNTAPAAGEISGNSDLITHRANYTDRDANDLTLNWQDLTPGDVVNIGGILYKIKTLIQNANDLEFTHDPIANQVNQTGGDTLFVQGIGDDAHVYRFFYFKDGVATGNGLPYAIGEEIQLVLWLDRVDLDDYFDQSLWDMRVAKEVATAPDLECIFLAADIRGTLL